MCYGTSSQVDRLAKLYATLTDEQKEEALSVHILSSAAAAKVGLGRATEEVAGWLAHLLSALPDETDESLLADDATASRVILQLLGTLPDDAARLAIASAVLVGCPDAEQAGVSLANVMLGHAAKHSHTAAVRGLAKRLHVDEGLAAAREPTPAAMERTVLDALQVAPASNPTCAYLLSPISYLLSPISNDTCAWTWREESLLFLTRTVPRLVPGHPSPYPLLPLAPLLTYARRTTIPCLPGVDTLLHGLRAAGCHWRARSRRLWRRRWCERMGGRRGVWSSGGWRGPRPCRRWHRGSVGSAASGGGARG